MNYKNGLLCFGMLCLVMIASCGGDDDNGGNDGLSGNVNCADFGTQYQGVLSDYSTALTNWSSAPTAANCSAFLSATDDYIDFLEDLIDCFPVGDTDRAEFEQALTEYRTERDNIGSDCSGLE